MRDDPFELAVGPGLEPVDHLDVDRDVLAQARLQLGYQMARVRVGVGGAGYEPNGYAIGRGLDNLRAFDAVERLGGVSIAVGPRVSAMVEAATPGELRSLLEEFLAREAAA